MNAAGTRARLAARHAPWAPWAGLIAGPLGWLLHHQIGSDLVFWRCRLGGAALSAGLGLVCVAIALAGAWWSWRAIDEVEPGRTVTPSKRFLGTIAAGSALLFALTIVAQSIGGFVYEVCQR